MRYTIDANRTGVFRSKLELRWFAFLRQKSSLVQYVGHVDRWRDFVFMGCSVEVKPQFDSAHPVEIASKCFERVPSFESELLVVIGDPNSFVSVRANRASILVVTGIFDGIS
jgi:hypothetical protein